MASTATTIKTPARRRSGAVILTALACGFALSLAWRTVTAIMAAPLQAEFQLDAQALGLFAGTFAFAFGAMQLFMGIGIDLYGVRRTVLRAFPLAIGGSALSALAQNYPTLVFAQVLIGIGCAPAFLACTVFIARRFAAERFAAISGLTMGFGGIGMLLTGTPLAWVIEAASWRAGFWVLTGLAGAVWLSIFWLVHDAPPAPSEADTPRESARDALARFGAIFTMRHSWGIVLLGSITYAAFIALRGLWLGPLLIERHGFSLVQSGNVALLVSLASLFGPPLFGRLDPGPARRRRWIVALALLQAALFALFATLHSRAVDVAGPVLIGLLSGFLILQYADVRAAYPASLTGRAMAVFTMSMFLGVAAMQWFTGFVAATAGARGIEPYAAVLASIAALLALGAIGFRLLPAPPPVG